MTMTPEQAAIAAVEWTKDRWPDATLRDRGALAALLSSWYAKGRSDGLEEALGIANAECHRRSGELSSEERIAAAIAALKEVKG